jgi:acyl-CoA hydrolase
VNLRGLNGYERAAALISIAHPDDRAGLEKEAREHGLIPPKFPANFLPQEGGNRRYPACSDRRAYKMPMGSALWGYDWDPIQSGK